MKNGISIHAPRAGCDAAMLAKTPIGSISIHAPRAGCDFDWLRYAVEGGEFQSTHPVRGAT